MSCFYGKALQVSYKIAKFGDIYITQITFNFA